jgi:hypothetical protein
MRFVLHASSPGGKNSLFALPSKGRILIGRHSPADIVIDDQFISGSHCSIECSNGIFTLTDTESRNGTLVNGLRLRQAVLQHGDAICAGQSFLKLTAMIDETLAKPILTGCPPGRSNEQNMLITAIRGACSFALLDSAVDPGVLELLKEGGAFFQSLYEGEQAIPIARFGPFLVDLSKAPHLLPHLILSGWGKSWGIYVRTAQSFQELRHHLRTLLLVDLAGERAIFRFYDPRVLPLFLRTATQEQRAKMFGPVEGFVLETGRTGAPMLFSQFNQQPVELSLTSIPSQ